VRRDTVQKGPGVIAMNELHRCKDCQNWDPNYDLFNDGCKCQPGRRFPRAQSYELRECGRFHWNPEQELTELETRVLEALKEHCRGKANASTASDLALLAGLPNDTDGRNTREVVSQLRRKGDVHGVLIASGTRGYYVPQDDNESLECLQVLQSREKELVETRSKYEVLHQRRWGNGRRSA
jgi:hypothetical protein